MSAKRRIVLCFLSASLASGCVAISGVWSHTARLLHKWYAGVLTIFLLFFVVGMFLTVRGRIATSPWAILICAALAYPAASLASIVYFALFEHERFVNTLSHNDIFGVTLILFFYGPTISFGWLFGGIAGLIFVLLGRALDLQNESVIPR